MKIKEIKVIFKYILIQNLIILVLSYIIILKFLDIYLRRILYL
jgi:hypothetical protein